MPSSASAAEQPAAARHLARAILSEGRFHEPTVPRPLHTALREIGRALESPVNAVNELVDKIAGSTPGGAPTGVGGARPGARRGCRRAGGHRRAPRGQGARCRARGRRRPASAARLRARTRGRRGRTSRALRRRRAPALSRGRAVAVRAGAAERRLLEAQPRLVRELHSPAFEQLAGRFDEIAYGADAADEHDAERARDGWGRVLEEAKRG